MNKLVHLNSQKQIQELGLRPKMLQSLQILALPYLELEMQIKRELELNPILELEDEDEEKENYSENDTEDQSAESHNDEEDELVYDLNHDNMKEIKELSDILDSWNEFQKEDSKYNIDSEDKRAYDNYTTDIFQESYQNKKDLFFDQLDYLSYAKNEILFAKELLDSIDDYGYLSKEIDIYELGKEYFYDDLEKQLDNKPDIAKAVASKVDEIHKTLMSFTPQGITARNVPECLISQLSEADYDYTLLVKLLEDHFDDLIHRRYQRIATKLSTTLIKVYQLKDKLSHLNPKPGLQLLPSFADYVVPDVIVKKIDEEYVVIVNDYNVPHLTISRRYRSLLTSGKMQDKEALPFIRDKINSAKFFIKSIYMRNRTIKRVMRSIINHQKSFFFQKSATLEPLAYNAIANDLNVSESTISRVVKDKYVDTPFGVYCMKEFFTSTAGRTDTYQNISRQNIQQHIIRMVSQEDKQEPVSDLQIVMALKEMNINVSRRVIAKYRESIGILNSRLRRSE